MSRKILLAGGRVVDPSQGFDDVSDVLLVDGTIASVGPGLDAPEDAEVVDCAGLLVVPGLIDVHVHLREPGEEHKETIATGARAAAAGGFTAICAMPNTDPAIDDPAAVGFVLAEGRRAQAARVYPVGCISVGRSGERLAPVGEMVAAGAVAITDDGSPVMNSGLMRLALEYAQTFGIPVADHPEDLGLSAAGHMNEGLIATRLGLGGKPNAAEDIHIIRDILLAELTGGHIHLQHVSTRYGVESIRQAKARGVHVTAEASPHHLVLTEEAVEGYRTEAKMNPPLRTSEDVRAVRAGLADGTLDMELLHEVESWGQVRDTEHFLQQVRELQRDRHFSLSFTQHRANEDRLLQGMDMVDGISGATSTSHSLLNALQQTVRMVLRLEHPHDSFVQAKYAEHRPF